MTRRLLLAVAALAALVVCSCTTSADDTPPEPQITTSTIDLSDVDLDDLDPSAGVSVTPSGADAAAVAVPVEAVRDLGDGNVVVTAFVAPCAQVTEATVSDDGTAEVLVADVDCSAERVLVEVTVEAS